MAWRCEAEVSKVLDAVTKVTKHWKILLGAIFYYVVLSMKLFPNNPQNRTLLLSTNTMV